MQKAVKIFLYIGIISFLSCKKDPKNTTVQESGNNITLTNNVDFNITNTAGNQILVMNTQKYVNQNQDTFSVTLYKYYISNIKLFRQDGFIFTEHESYRLINNDDTSGTCKFTIHNVPLGNYISMEFIIGVDSLRNCDGAQTGALDPINDMFWTWSQGYIFAKLQGTSNVGGFIWHIGGFTGPYNAIVKATPSFNSNMIQVDQDHVSKVYLKADVLEWFKTPSTIDISAYSSVASGKKSQELAANYSDMFSVAAIKH